MCHYIFVFFAAAAVAHLMPKQSHYTIQGIGLPNSVIDWSPQYSDIYGMIFFHAIGNSTLKFGNTEIKVEREAFFHTHGHMPEMSCESETVCKVVAHLIV